MYKRHPAWMKDYRVCAKEGKWLSLCEWNVKTNFCVQYTCVNKFLKKIMYNWFHVTQTQYSSVYSLWKKNGTVGEKIIRCEIFANILYVVPNLKPKDFPYWCTFLFCIICFRKTEVMLKFVWGGTNQKYALLLFWSAEFMAIMRILHKGMWHCVKNRFFLICKKLVIFQKLQHQYAMKKIAEESLIFLLYENTKQYQVVISLRPIKNCFPLACTILFEYLYYLKLNAITLLILSLYAYTTQWGLNSVYVVIKLSF